MDFDQVTLSSTNRHATATLRDVGTPKVAAVKRFLADAVPNCEVILVNEMFNTEGEHEEKGVDFINIVRLTNHTHHRQYQNILSLSLSFLAAAAGVLDGHGKIDFVVDAIDDIPTKAQLVKACIDR